MSFTDKDLGSYVWDFILLGLLLVTFYAGFLVGQNIQFKKDYDFFTKYIDNSCDCQTQLEITNGMYSQLRYQKVFKVNISNFENILPQR